MDVLASITQTRFGPNLGLGNLCLEPGLERQYLHPHFALPLDETSAQCRICSDDLVPGIADSVGRDSFLEVENTALIVPVIVLLCCREEPGHDRSKVQKLGSVLLLVV